MQERPVPFLIIAGTFVGAVGMASGAVGLSVGLGLLASWAVLHLLRKANRARKATNAPIAHGDERLAQPLLSASQQEEHAPAPSTPLEPVPPAAVQQEVDDAVGRRQQQHEHEGGGNGAEPPPAEPQPEEEVTVKEEELIDADAAPSPVQPWLASAAAAKQQTEVSQLPSSPSSSIPLFSSFGLVPPAGQPFGMITSSPMVHLPPVAEGMDEGCQPSSTLEFSKEESPVSGSHRRKRSLLSDSLGGSADDLPALNQSSSAVQQQQQQQQQQRQQHGPPPCVAVEPSALSASSQPSTPISLPQHQPEGGSAPGSYLEEALISPLRPPRTSLMPGGAPQQPSVVAATSSAPLPWQKPSAQSPWALQQGGAGFDSAWGGLGHAVQAERMSSASSDRRLPRLLEETQSQRGSLDVPLAIKLDVVAGPCADQHVIAGEDESQLEISIGRTADNGLVLADSEVSGRHAVVKWNSLDRCWQVSDEGSLNGTLLNGEPISVPGRQRGQQYRLSSDDILQLGSFTKIKVSTFPRDLLDPLAQRHGSLPVGSMPRSLTMPKQRIPSFTLLPSPKITSTPSRRATAAAASDELRLECCIVSCTGRDHQRRGQVCEDVAVAECPLHGSEAALDGSPAALFCVFDGHCGRNAAEAASTALPDEVADRLAGAKEALTAGAGAAAMLREAFLATDDRIATEEGCTATALLMWRDRSGDVCLQAANVGDSSALLIDPASTPPPRVPLPLEQQQTVAMLRPFASGSGSGGEGAAATPLRPPSPPPGSGEATPGVVSLTEDHRLTNPRERARLAALGIQLGDNARRLYGLNLSRGLGDKFLKDEDLGLSAEPYVSGVARVMKDRGCILVIASDGLWDVSDAEHVAACVLQADREHDGDVTQVTAAVIDLALKHRTKDDVTALVVRVWPASEWELRSPTANLDDGKAASFVS